MNKTLERLLGAVFDNLREGLRESVTPDEYARLKRDFVFHMTDGKDDLAEFVELLSEPNDVSADSATTAIVGFLYHVVPHLNAAYRLLLDDAPTSLG